MVSAIYILHYPTDRDSFRDTSNFECLTSRRYHDDHVPDDNFILSSFYKRLERLDEGDQLPVLYINRMSYVYLRCANGVLILAVTPSNDNVMSMIMFLRSFELILIHYLCKKKKSDRPFTKETILDNLIIITELFDECMDFGILQVTDYKLLEEYIKAEPNLPKLEIDNDYENSSSSHDEGEEDGDDAKVDEAERSQNNRNSNNKKKKKKNDKKKGAIKSTHNQAVKTDVLDKGSQVVNSSILRTYSSAIHWRPKGIFYAKNEIFVDIIEDCEFIFDLETSSIKRNEIHGTCVLKSYLSGIPICRVGFNEGRMTSLRYDDEDIIEVNNRNTNNNNNNNNSEASEPLPENQIACVVEEEEEEEGEEEDEEEHTGDGNKDNASEYSSETSSMSSSARRAQAHKFPIRSIQFHQCIELSKIYNENIMTFIPPDDKFVLMSYNIDQQKNRKKPPLILIKPVFKIVKNARALQVMCTLTTNFPRRRHCKNLILRIPVNPFLFELNLDMNLKFKAEKGDVSLKIDRMEVIWKIESIDGKQTVRMMCELSLLNSAAITESTISDFVHRRISKEELMKRDQHVANGELEDDLAEAKHELDGFYGVNGHGSSSMRSALIERIKRNFVSDDIVASFKIPMFTHSGLKLTYLSVEEDQMKYPCFPWVRYLTESVDSEMSVSVPDRDHHHVHDSTYRFKLGVSSFIIT
ncbi:uncharacterized protein LODBEIA_P45370 [Lodderomyces beijingensis]|uniref:MHD domain-containing protein n=1 Tax=Lodderomyces beijingensis TaxID=1775926 RepID=A0ABP0ZQ85_9ASCO